MLNAVRTTSLSQENARNVMQDKEKDEVFQYANFLNIDGKGVSERHFDSWVINEERRP